MDQTEMREAINGEYKEEDQEEVQAAIDIWKYVFGFTEMAVIKCAIDLGIADMLHQNGGSMTLSELSSCLECPPHSLYRIMRFLVHHKIFTQKITSQDTLSYNQTPLSRRLLSHGKDSMAAFLLLESTPVMLAPWLGLRDRVRGTSKPPFEASHGEDLWSYAANNPCHSKLFSDAMACDARVVVPQIIKVCPNLFDSVSIVVDVGGSDGTTLSLLVEAYKWIQGINFDLPHVVSCALPCDRVEHVGGNMFDMVPKADVAFLMWVLHDWGDEECIEILKKCREAIGKDKGKVVIVEAVMEENTEDKLEDARLMLDMVMMAHTTNGKERTLKQWNYVIIKAGFSRFNVTPIHAVQSVIQAYP